MKLKFGYYQFIIFPIIIIVIYFAWCYYQPHTTILLLRHADREGSQDLLSQAGIDRAAELVHVMEKTGITAIFNSEALRTQRTAQDIAIHLNISPIQISAADVSGLTNEILSNHTGETVMVVSHSNRVPEIIAALGGGDFPDIDHDEYDNLFIVVNCQCWWRETSVTKLQYGVLSP